MMVILMTLRMQMKMKKTEPPETIVPLNSLHDEGAPQQKKQHTPIMDGYHETHQTTSVVRLRLQIPPKAFANPRKANIINDGNNTDDKEKDLNKIYMQLMTQMKSRDSIENDSDCIYNGGASTMNNDADDTDETDVEWALQSILIRNTERH
eukprot:298965_1